jgi:hypothetical protein
MIRTPAPSDPSPPPSPSGARRRPSRLVAGCALFAALALGGLVQAGVLAPVIRGGSEGGGNGSYFVSMSNQSWVAFTVREVRFSGGGVSRTLPGGGSATLALYPTPALAAGGTGAVQSVTVGGDQSFGLGIKLRKPGCEASTGPAAATKLTIEFGVSTPLGTRDVEAAITVACPGGVIWSAPRSGGGS